MYKKAALPTVIHTSFWFCIQTLTLRTITKYFSILSFKTGTDYPAVEAAAVVLARGPELPLHALDRFRLRGRNVEPPGTEEKEQRTRLPYDRDTEHVSAHVTIVVDATGSVSEAVRLPQNARSVDEEPEDERGGDGAQNPDHEPLDAKSERSLFVLHAPAQDTIAISVSSSAQSIPLQKHISLINISNDYIFIFRRKN